MNIAEFMGGGGGGGWGLGFRVYVLGFVCGLLPHAAVE